MIPAHAKDHRRHLVFIPDSFDHQADAVPHALRLLLSWLVGDLSGESSYIRCSHIGPAPGYALVFIGKAAPVFYFVHVGEETIEIFSVNYRVKGGQKRCNCPISVAKEFLILADPSETTIDRGPSEVKSGFFS